MKEFEFITSWDDGRSEDLRLAKLLLKYQIPAIFYIPSNTELAYGDITALYQQGFQIGGHTSSHPEDMKVLSDSEQFMEIMANKRYLEGILNLIGEVDITSFCYPSGKYNDITIECLKKAGFKEARTTKILRTDKAEDPFRIATTVHVYPNKKEYKDESWAEVAKNLYDEAKDKKGYFHLWGHSWEIEKFKLWEELETFFKYVKESREA